MTDGPDYKSTLNLPRTDFPMKADLARREPDRLAAWDAMDLEAKIRRHVNRFARRLGFPGQVACAYAGPGPACGVLAWAGSGLPGGWLSWVAGGAGERGLGRGLLRARAGF